MEDLTLAQPVIVTGATGFIGRWLVRRLLAEGCYVRALVLPGEETRGVWEGPVEVARADITDAAAVAKAVQHAGTIFHLAALVGDWGAEAQFQRVAVGGTEHVLSSSGAGHARIVVVSSSVVYGDRIGREVCGEDSGFGRPQGPYSRAKQAQETVAWRIARERRLQVTVVRPANVFGHGSRPWVKEAAAILQRRLPILIGDGGQNAGLCYVENLVDLLILAAAHPLAPGRTYNACDGWDVTWRQYFTDLARLVDARPPRALPAPLARGMAGMLETIWRWRGSATRPLLTREAVNLVGAHHRLPMDRARQELGFAPRVDYAEAMAKLGEQIRRHGW